MLDASLPLSVIGAQFAMLEPKAQRDLTFICLYNAVERALARDADRVSVTEYDHLRYAVSTFEEGLYRRTIQQLELAEEIAAKVASGVPFTAVGRRNGYRLAMLRRRMDLARMVGPASGPDVLAC
ncbi:hypothetical protein SLNSH_13040 [Alsobacter soli]|uniref:Uncharacterized protein n=1 Tax=Alsobacter soli TaxID=2109933 RepID=A0A2T1HSR9_9HYPH|nr:hypothetical protein [Alsobacter soli]PSC04687.1 hypothetical protein SLNSH_13040 [Alsobacter soli]